jgi:hypothetical protein
MAHRWHRWAIPLALAGTALIALVAWPRFESSAPGGPLAPSLAVFRVTGVSLEPLGRRMAASDGLRFTYANPGSAFAYLMVYAVDGRGHSHWYYPALQNTAEDPQAVPIERQRTSVELHETVRQPLAPGPLALHALFLPRPLSVRELQAALARHAPVPEAVQRSWQLEVIP